jgi:hypothetical protein
MPDDLPITYTVTILRIEGGHKVDEIHIIDYKDVEEALADIEEIAADKGWLFVPEDDDEDA